MTDRVPRRALPPDDRHVSPYEEDDVESTVVLRRLALPADRGTPYVNPYDGPYDDYIQPYQQPYAQQSQPYSQQYAQQYQSQPYAQQYAQQYDDQAQPYSDEPIPEDEWYNAIRGDRTASAGSRIELLDDLSLPEVAVPEADPVPLAMPEPPESPESGHYPRYSAPTSHRRERRPSAPKRRPAPKRHSPAADERVHSGSHHRSSKPAIIVIGVVLTIVALVGTLVWGITEGPLRPTQPTPIGPQAPDALLSSEDLSRLGLGSQWSANPTSPSPADFACVGDVVTQDPAPRWITRGLVSGTDQTNTVIQLSATYANVDQATAAFDKAVTLSGTCPSGAAQVVGAFTVGGLADTAAAVTQLVWGPTPDIHTMLLARTGRTITFVDVTTTGEPVAVSSVAGASSSVMTRLCAGGQGTCPSTVTVATSVPAAGDPVGWLLPADLPRITPTAGIWNNPARDSVVSPGSRCEGVVLGSIAGTTSARQRTYLLTEDPNQSDAFGIDEIVYTFATAKDAATLAKSMDTNITGCAATVKTAAVTPGTAISGAGAGDVVISATPFTITHTIGRTVTVFRVSVIQAGTAVGYLIAPVTSDFDFTDAQWRDITIRAGERMTQALPEAVPGTSPTTRSDLTSPATSAAR